MTPATRLSSGVVQLQRVSDVKVDQARALRRNMTSAERILWTTLRGKKCGGLKFRRQQKIEGFITDFFCPEKNLVIEVDGSVHESEEQKKMDEHRRAVFKSRGLLEIRFSNNDVFKNINNVQEKILFTCGFKKKNAEISSQ